ncbi:MAG TPA: hypothetical protein VI669_04585, partial [Vicinamibacteria bacterium]
KLRSRLATPGFGLEAMTFTPRASAAAPRPKYEGVHCAGLRIRPEAPAPPSGYRLGLGLLRELRTLQPEFRLLREGAALDTLLGTKSVREALERGEEIEAILKRDETTTLQFRRDRGEALLY